MNSGGDKLVLKRRGEDGSKVVTIRIRGELLHDLDEAAKELNYSRNELISLILRHGLDNLEIQ